MAPDEFLYEYKQRTQIHISELQEKNDNLKTQLAQTTASLKQTYQENGLLAQENIKLSQKNISLKQENARLKRENERLKQCNAPEQSDSLIQDKNLEQYENPKPPYF